MHSLPQNQCHFNTDQHKYGLQKQKSNWATMAHQPGAFYFHLL